MIEKEKFSCFEEQNIAYWHKRAPGYSEVNRNEFKSKKYIIWEMLLEKYISKIYPNKKQNIQILDIGTGPVFFAIILAKKGFSVTAIDYTQSMLNEASKNDLLLV